MNEKRPLKEFEYRYDNEIMRFDEVFDKYDYAKDSDKVSAIFRKKDGIFVILQEVKTETEQKIQTEQRFICACASYYDARVRFKEILDKYIDITHTNIVDGRHIISTNGFNIVVYDTNKHYYNKSENDSIVDYSIKKPEKIYILNANTIKYFETKKHNKDVWYQSISDAFGSCKEAVDILKEYGKYWGSAYRNFSIEKYNLNEIYKENIAE